MTPIHIKILTIAVQVVLTLIYGSIGAIMTGLLYLRLGREKFLRRVPRPKPPSEATDPVYGTHDMIKLKSSNVTLHYVSKGTKSQPLMLFVHGFPECWYTWRYQMKYFAKDYRVVAIDLRGYGLSSKPDSVKDYKPELLARDIADVIEQLGYDSCILVGHDWGGAIAWLTTLLHPTLVKKLIIMNCPHPRAFREHTSVGQLRRSWYMFFYQLPYIPELLIQADDFSAFNRVFYEKPMGLDNVKNMSKGDLEVFKYTFSQEGTPTAAINYYRAMFRHQNDKVPRTVRAPTLIVWGCQDAALGEKLADASVSYCSNVQLKKIKNASHWVQQDEPEQVNRYMEAFLNEQ